MSPSWRSLITLSPKLAYDDYETSLVTADLDMLEIGARQLNDWRLHELPDVFPSYRPGVPFNTPILSLAAMSSLPTTWSVHFSFIFFLVCHTLLSVFWFSFYCLHLFLACLFVLLKSCVETCS